MREVCVVDSAVIESTASHVHVAATRGIACTCGNSRWRASAGKRAGLRAVDSLDVHVLHVRAPSKRGIARTRGISRWCQRQGGGGRGFEGCRLTRRPCAACSRNCNTEHHTHTGRQPLEPAPAGKVTGLRAGSVTGRSCAAYSPPCNTRHRTHAGRQPLEPAPARKGAGLRLVGSRGSHVLHVRATATRAGTRGVSCLEPVPAPSRTGVV